VGHPPLAVWCGVWALGGVLGRPCRPQLCRNAEFCHPEPPRPMAQAHVQAAVGHRGRANECFWPPWWMRVAGAAVGPCCGAWVLPWWQQIVHGVPISARYMCLCGLRQAVREPYPVRIWVAWWAERMSRMPCMGLAALPDLPMLVGVCIAFAWCYSMPAMSVFP